eukprot:gene13167-3965_t
MADIVSEIVLDGGGPWGFRLQGGKDFGIPLNVSRVTPGSKAALKQMVVGDIICEINGFNMESLSHMEAQNHIKNAGSTLNMKIRKGKGISVGDQNAMSFGSAGSPKVLTETNVIHSASVDHTFNPKPKPFNFGTNSPTVTQGVSPQKSSPAPPAQAPKFDPGAYARKKKEELEQRKKAESTVAEDSDILKMINATSISKSPSPTSHSQTEGLSNVGKAIFSAWPCSVKEDCSLQIYNQAEGSDPGAFRMVYSGRDIHEEVSPGSKSVISSLKDRVSQENSGLNSESKVPSRVFQMLQKQLDEEQAEGIVYKRQSSPLSPTPLFVLVIYAPLCTHTAVFFCAILETPTHLFASL